MPVGIKIDPPPGGGYPAAEKYAGISYCDAVHRASEGGGRALLLEPDSIGTCLWSPVVLGFRDPDPALNLKVEYNLPRTTGAVLVAPLESYASDAPPDVVLLRAPASEIKKIIRSLDPGDVALELAGRLDRSALSIFAPDGDPVDVRRVMFVNTALARLNRFERWRGFTKWLFRRQWTTFLFDLLLDRFLANMSMCRNSTVIPYLTGKANVSYFCTGGIAWGLNRPGHVVCGMPFALYEKIRGAEENGVM